MHGPVNFRKKLTMLPVVKEGLLILYEQTEKLCEVLADPQFRREHPGCTDEQLLALLDQQLGNLIPFHVLHDLMRKYPAKAQWTSDEFLNALRHVHVSRF